MTMPTEPAPDFERLMRQADELRDRIADAIAIAKPLTTEAHERLRRIEMTFDALCIAQWARLSLVDGALEGSLAKSFEAQIGLVAAGAFDYPDAEALVATYRPIVEAIRRKGVN